MSCVLGQPKLVVRFNFMKHILNVLMIICFSITTIIYVSHLTQTEKIVDSSSNNKIRIDSTIFFNYSISLIKLNKNAINTLVRIYDIKKDIQISDVNIYLNDSEYNIVSINTEKTGYLYMTYSEYSTIPDSLRILNKNGFQNIIFKFEGNDSAKNIINLKLSLITKDTKYLLSDNIEYKIIS